jgi:hypothetical protein
MARAYDILGLRAHHGLDMFGMPDGIGHKQWAMLERAADGSWPSPSSPGPKFKREDWDSLFGEYDVVTDVGSVFADQLIEAYPEAKVVLVQRDFEPWWESFQVQVLDGLFSPATMPLLTLITYITGQRGGRAMQKTLLGFFGASDADGIRQNARKTWEGYYKRIREIVPEERRLEYKLGQGWEPLCKFLGKEVPKGVDFPRVNDKEEHRARQMEDVKVILGMCWAACRIWIFGVFGATVVALVVWIS